MSCEITVGESRRRIVMRIDGEITLDLVREYMEELIDLSEETGLFRYLFDVRRARNVVSVIDNYFYANREAARPDLPRTLRSAIFHDPDDTTHNFVVTAFRNAGHNVRGFEDRDKAVAWLEKD